MLGLGASMSMPDRLFSLNDISNLSLYLKNGVGITLDSGGAGGASQWDDSSGNAKHAVQATTGDQAIPAEGGLTFELDEADHYDLPSSINIVNTQGFTIFVVCKFQSMGDHGTILSLNGTAHFFEFKAGNDDLRIKLGNSGTSIIFDDNNSFPNGEKFLLSLVRQKGVTGNLIARKNGIILSQAEDGQKSNNKDAEFITIGTRNNDRYFDGTIHELAFYDKQLTDYELDDVHSYLIDKHGL